MTALRQQMIDDMILHGLKPKTIKAYVPCVARFADISASRPLSWERPIRAYLLYVTHDRQVSASPRLGFLDVTPLLARLEFSRAVALDDNPAA